MERRKDKNNRVLKDGESYREKEHRYMYRWIDSDKKRHCTYAQTLRELRKKEAEINRNKSDGISSAGSNLRLDDVYKLWKKNKVGLKQSTYVNYLYMYDHFIGPKIGKMKIKDIRKSTILGLYNDLTRSNDIGKTMAINTLDLFTTYCGRSCRLLWTMTISVRIQRMVSCAKLSRPIITNARSAKR